MLMYVGGVRVVLLRNFPFVFVGEGGGLTYRTN